MTDIQAPWIGRGPDDDDCDREEKYYEDQESMRDWRRDMKYIEEEEQKEKQKEKQKEEEK